MAGGRPTLYDPDVHPAAAEALAREGKTNTEIAEGIGISRATLTIWQREYPEFLAAIKAGKATPDDLVENSLYKRALGYEYTETKVVKDEFGTVIKTEVITKQVAPDVGAQCMWLKNRRAQEWQDRVKQEISGPDGSPIEIISKLSDEEVISRARRLLTSRESDTACGSNPLEHHQQT